MKRYFKVLDTEETRDMFEGLIGETLEMVGFSYTCKEQPELGGMYELKTEDDTLYFHQDEVVEVAH